MSFVCEKCGFRDDPRWRNQYYDPHTSIMNWGDFEVLYPSLFKRLQGPVWTREGPYIYQRTPAKWPPRFVIRGIVEEFEARGGSLNRPTNYEDITTSPKRAKRHALLANLGYTIKTEKLAPKEKITSWR